MKASADGVPIITSLSPAFGPPNTTILINGTNFDSVISNNIVYFGPVKAAVLSASVTQLSVSSPTGAVYGPVSVTTSNGLRGDSFLPFMPTYSPGSPLNTNSFAAPLTLPAGDRAYTATTGDLNGDGKPDIAVVSYSSNNISIFQNICTNGILDANSFAAPFFLSVAGPQCVVLQDVDGDGKLDVIATSYVSNRVAIFRNISTNVTLNSDSFASPFFLDTGSGTGPRNLAIADLNADGKPEIITANNTSGTVSVFQNYSTPGGVTFGTNFQFRAVSAGSAVYDVAIADINGDSKPDILVGCYSSSLVIFKNQASGNITNTSFAAPTIIGGTGSGLKIALLDFNNDGKLDVALGTLSGYGYTLYANKTSGGSISFSTLTYLSSSGFGSDGHGIAAGDLDGDGKPDLVLCKFYADGGSGFEPGNVVFLLRNLYDSGSTNFYFFNTNKMTVPSGAFPSTVTIDDLDGDGRPDLVIANYTNNVLTILQNATIPPRISSQPTTTVAAPGDNVTLATGIVGLSPLTYEWQFDGGKIATTTVGALNLPNISPVQIGSYQVIVSNSFGTVTSSLAHLSLFSLQPSGGLAGLTLTGVAGDGFQIQALNDFSIFPSTNNWQALTNITLSANPYFWMDPDSITLPKRFYRAVPLP